MKFRYDINALRAIAVTGVLLFHYHVPFFAGGFSGVDAFFVISGYLMSRIIINGIKDEKFSILNFYAKRAKRIIPALLFLVLGIAIAGFFVYFPADYQQNLKNATSSILFLSNFFYWQHSNYFDPSSDTNILLHTWTLSVEWQFYLIYPLILVLINKFVKSRKAYLSIFLISIAAFFILSIVMTKIAPTASFFLLPSRAWELLAGGIAFLVEDFIKNDRVKRILSIVGYISVFAGFVFLNSLMLWPGLYTLIPVIGTFLILISNFNSYKVIKIEAVQILGKISYSLYLWHWPVYVIAQYVGFDTNKITSIILLIVISIMLAYLSFKLIEKPDFEARYIIIATVVFALGTLSISFSNLNHVIFKQKAIEISTYSNDHAAEKKKQFNEGCCFITSDFANINNFNKRQCLNISGNEKNILLIGDSHAAHLSESLREMLNKQNIHLLQASASGCLPIIRPNGKSRCYALMNYVYKEYLANNAHKLDGVIISANWEDSRTEPGELVTDLQNTIGYFKKYNINVIIIGQNETYTVPFPSIAAREYQYNINNSANYLNGKASFMNDYLKEKLDPYYIEVYRKFTFPQLSADRVPYMIDQNHFSKYGADLMTGLILSDKKTIAFLNAKSNTKLVSALN